MRTRSRKRKIPEKKNLDSECSQVEQSCKELKLKRRKKNIKEDSIPLYSPTFNIHIHIPQIEKNVSEISLPKIEPVFHLHFDKVGKALKMNGDKFDEKSLHTGFKKLLRMSATKLGNVNFHVKKKSNKRKTKILDKGIQPPVTADFQLNSNKIKEKIQSDNSDIEKKNCDSSDDKNVSNENSEPNENCRTPASKDLKLKKAVVELTDICKLAFWNKASNSIIRESVNVKEENNSSQGSPDKMDGINEENIENEEKVANPEDSGRNTNESLHNNFEAVIKEIKSEEIIIKTPISEESGADENNLTGLDEGCNLSEIFNRLKNNSNEEFFYNENHFEEGEYHNFYENCDINSNEEDNNFEEIKPNSPVYNDEEEENEIITNLDNDNVDNDDDQFSMSSPSFLQSPENFCNLPEDDLSHEEKEKLIKYLVRHCYDNESSSEEDGNNISSNSMKLVSDGETSTLLQDRIEDQKSINKNLFDVGSVDFHLKLIKKELKRRSQPNTNISKKHKNSKKPRKSEVGINTPEKTPSPNKMKHPKNTPQRKKLVFPTDDYIPLDSSGSTKFAIANVDTISPYKTHSARNFKQEMLFGKRVKRYSSPEKHRVYQLKKEAVRNSSFKKEKM